MKLLYDLMAQLDVSPLPQVQANNTAVSNVLTIVFEVVGAVTFLILVISGLRYILAAGDPAKMAQAKKSIIYALVGLAVVLSAYAIVIFVVKGVG